MTHVALLRAVNVGGTGKLQMAELREICEGIGFGDVRTLLASGNVVFTSSLSETEIVDVLGDRLADHMGAPVGVLVRTGEQIRAVLADNPFPDAPGNRVTATFLPDRPPADTVETIRHRGNERVAVGEREIYVWYPDGIGASKLKMPAGAAGTARNMNTIAKLAGMI